MNNILPECGVWQQIVAWPPKKYKDFKEVELGEKLVESREFQKGRIGLFTSVRSQKKIKNV